MPIPDQVRYFNKRFLNRAMMKIAGVAHSPISIVRHTGRRSGKTYQTPIIVRAVSHGFVFALTYGDQVDWYRNIQAAGECTVRWQGKEYALEKPETLAVDGALLAFPPPLRPILKMAGVRHFFQMKYKI